MPTGGVEINADNLKTWFKAGVCGVGMGSKLVSKKILENKAYDELYSLTTKAFEIINKVKP